MKIIKVRVSDEETDAFAAEKMPHVKKAIASAKSVLSIFEKEYPGDKRPRKAIEAAEAWVKNPTERNRVLAGKFLSQTQFHGTAAAAASYAVFAAYAASSRAIPADEAAASAAKAASRAASEAKKMKQ